MGWEEEARGTPNALFLSCTFLVAEGLNGEAFITA